MKRSTRLSAPACVWAVLLVAACAGEAAKPEGSGGAAGTTTAGTTSTGEPNASTSSGVTTGGACACGDHGTCGPGPDCRCDYGWTGDSCEVCDTGFHLAGELCLLDEPGVAHYPLEIIQPRPGRTLRNRFYKAYPGLDFNVRLAVIGGVYPYAFEIVEAPAGMTVGASTGVVDWPDPVEAGSPHAIGLRVTDQAGSTTSVTWTVTVTEAGFLFLDAVDGKTVAEGGLGTRENPWRTLGDMYGGTDPDSKNTSDHAGEIAYFRNGAYAAGDAFLEDVESDGTGRVPLVGGNKPLVWLAYPGETPELDLSSGFLAIYGGGDDAYFEGFRVTGMTNYARKGISLDPSDQVTIRRCRFEGMPPGGIGGSNNQSNIMISRGDGVIGNDYAFVDNEFDDNFAYSVIAYTTNEVLFEGNSIENVDGNSPVIGPKIDNTMWFIRANRLKSIVGSRAIWLNDGGETADQEVSYNLVIAPEAEAALSVNQEGSPSTGPAYIFRNTFVGPATFLSVSSTTGPFELYDNVIVNAAGPTGYVCESCGDPSRIEASDNLVGALDEGVVSLDTGELLGSYRTFCGSRGHALACP